MKIITLAICMVLIPFICPYTTATPQTPEQQNNVIDPVKRPLSSSQEAKWSQLVGTWFGNQPTKDGGRYMWITQQNNDGTYRMHFRLIDASGKRQDKIEVGEWGVAGDVYFDIYKGDLKDGQVIPVDPTNPYNRDAYRILTLTKDVFEYEYVDSDTKFTAKRVPVDFDFPEQTNP